MPGDRFRLGWFLQGSTVQSWAEPWTGNIGEEWMQPALFIDLARSMERACFDYMLLEDSSYVGEAYGKSRDIYLKYGMSVPCQDPSVIASTMLAATTQSGRRRHLRNLCVSPLPPGEIGRDTRSGLGRPGGLERGDRKLGLRGDEFRCGWAAGARPAPRNGRRIHRRRHAALGFVGTGCDNRRPNEWYPYRSIEGSRH